jgi:hypothetical protein
MTVNEKHWMPRDFPSAVEEINKGVFVYVVRGGLGTGSIVPFYVNKASNRKRSIGMDGWGLSRRSCVYC